MFFSMSRSSCLTEADGGPERYWLLSAGLLVDHFYNLNIIVLSNGVSAAAE